MRYHYKRPNIIGTTRFGESYICNHPVYSRCTLFRIGKKGLAVIQQRFHKETKSTYWDEIDLWLERELYFNLNFKPYFEERAGECFDGLYPTVTIRQIMWALKMKPLKRERWETVFDRKNI